MSQTKNLALQKQESELLKISEERKFYLAVSDKPIKDLPEINLREALRYSMVKIGLRGANYPKGVEKSLLLQHVYENFGDLTPSEVRLAFDWAINGRLCVDVNCFENFSCKYVSDILNAYKKLRNAVEDVKDDPVLIEYKPDPAEIDKEFEAFKNNPENKRFFPSADNK